MELDTWLPLTTVAIAVAGVLFGALRYNREDASAVVAQQSTVLSDMKALNDELAEAAERVRSERNELRERVIELTSQIGVCAAQVGALKDEVRALRSDLRRADSPPRMGGSRYDDPPR